MATPNSTFTEIVTTTLRNHKSKLADNVSNHNALWGRLSKKGNVRQIGGGYEIVEPLDYAENSTFQRYSGLDVLNIGSSEVLSAAKFDWKQASTSVVISGLELRQNSGRESIINLMNSRIKNAERTMANNLSSDIYSDGSTTNQMGGIQHIITDDGTGTVGGINSGTYTFWANQFQEASGTVAASTIGKDMKDLWLKTARGMDTTDLIVSSTDLFSLYWDSLTDLQRFASSESAGEGFQSLKFVDADVIHDTGDSGIPTTHMYFLNTDYLKLVVHRDAFLEPLAERTPLQQDAVVVPMIFQGNLCCSNRARQGVLIDAA